MRQITIGSYVQVIQDKDYGLLIKRKGTVQSIAHNKFWIEFDNHRILLPFSAEEIKRTTKRKA